jgi:hypothetical protein
MAQKVQVQQSQIPMAIPIDQPTFKLDAMISITCFPDKVNEEKLMHGFKDLNPLSKHNRI